MFYHQCQQDYSSANLSITMFDFQMCLLVEEYVYLYDEYRAYAEET